MSLFNNYRHFHEGNHKKVLRRTNRKSTRENSWAAGARYWPSLWTVIVTMPFTIIVQKKYFQRAKYSPRSQIVRENLIKISQFRFRSVTRPSRFLCSTVFPSSRSFWTYCSQPTNRTLESTRTNRTTLSSTTSSTSTSSSCSMVVSS